MQPQVHNRTIFTGDNLPILRGMNTESVDLVYLDPPFNSNRNYEAPVGSKAAHKIEKGDYDKIVYRHGKTEVALNDWWHISILNSQSKERTGYPTQKPMALLDRIIKASCPQGGLVLDPFCGCATTCVAAEKYGRQWIGIDISAKAVELVRTRLHKDLGIVTADDKKPQCGMPKSSTAPTSRKEARAVWLARTTSKIFYTDNRKVFAAFGDTSGGANIVLATILITLSV